MGKKFNVNGSCNPAQHYMVDTSRQFAKTTKLVGQGEYFIINRPRQYGKTTMLTALFRALCPEHLVGYLSFEGIGDSIFTDEKRFSQGFVEMLADSLRMSDVQASDALLAGRDGVGNLKTLSKFLVEFIGGQAKSVILLIDEVDKASNSQLFLSFLGMLREQYLARANFGAPAFQSVVLAGIHDIKSLKPKIRPDAETKLNSPWNIAADFNVDMSFDPAEIKTMLVPYAQDKGVAMDFDAVAARIHYYSSGHPFLVSKLCKDIDEEAPAANPAFDPKSWTTADVDWAFRWLTREDYSTTNFDDLVKNLENNPGLYRLVEDVLFGGEKEGVPFAVKEPTVNLGVLYGVLRNQQGKAAISNRVYEQILSDYIRAKSFMAGKLSQPEVSRSYYQDGRLNLEAVLTKFQAFMREHYSANDAAFLEREGRLVFMSFLRPILNGGGFMHKEPVVGEERRIDLAVSYGGREDVVETKIWRGQAYHERGLAQLSDYLDFKGLKTGYLLVFDFGKDKQPKSERIKFQDKELFAVWV